MGSRIWHSERFTPSMRLSQARQFSKVFDGARRSSDPLLVVLVIDNGEMDARLGLAISKKSAPRAVDRNRIKRLVRESFRCNQARLVGRDIVVLSKRGITGCTSRQVFESLEKHWQRLSSSRVR